MISIRRKSKSADAGAGVGDTGHHASWSWSIIGASQGIISHISLTIHSLLKVDPEIPEFSYSFFLSSGIFLIFPFVSLTSYKCRKFIAS